METALHDLVREVEWKLPQEQSALGVFIDIEGAFDHTPFDVIRDALRRLGTTNMVTEWTYSMLRTRTVTASFGATETRAVVTGAARRGECYHPCSGSLSWMSS
uniref:Reverse transcriptase domain-containing protein n=1 Tax=Bracon brevicornis TaxID=1563983 RepID=A0A6V7J6N3_9HYME